MNQADSENLVIIPEYDPKMLSHYNNIQQKMRIADTKDLKQVCVEVIGRYESYTQEIDHFAMDSGDFTKSISALNNYLDFAKEIEKTHKFFNWRSDFAGSIIPEFLYRAIYSRLINKGLTSFFSTRASVVEVTLSGTAGGGWEVRHKNQDLCMGIRRESVIKDGNEVSFVVPLIVFEVKTNIDINKFNGLDFSAERLKRTFPSARYFLVTETIDFSLENNYASSSLDEMYVLRKQLRSISRRQKEPLQYDVFAELVSDVEAIVAKASQDGGHVYDRLACGKLIDG